MGKQHEDRPEVRRRPSEPDRDVVAEAAERLLREADRALEDLRAGAERAAGDPAAGPRADSARPA